MNWRPGFELISIIIVIFFLYSIRLWTPDSAPTDSELRNHFIKNRVIFQKFLTLFISNKDLIQIRYEITAGKDRVVFYPGSAATNASYFNHKEIINNMKNILKVDNITRLSSDTTLRFSSITEVIYFSSYRFGFLDSSGEKGIAYFIQGRPKIEAMDTDLDQYDYPNNKNHKFPSGIEEMYSEIGDGWYLFSGI